MLYYDARCLMHYRNYHNLVYLSYSCQHGVSKLKLPVSNRQCPNRSGRYSIGILPFSAGHMEMAGARGRYAQTNRYQHLSITLGLVAHML